jgi:glutaconyl-CoA/methylmalonyl-CoA decarboxylase subunit gamma
MRYTVKIEDHSYAVEIQDLNARPIVALVDGEPFEVYPEEGGISLPENVQATSPVVNAPPVPVSNGTPLSSSVSVKVVRAPIPGVLISLAVKIGDEVSYGQELCVLEAMKMKNTVRASHPGRIGWIHAAVGQTLNHHDPIMEYEA